VRLCEEEEASDEIDVGQSKGWYVVVKGEEEATKNTFQQFFFIFKFLKNINLSTC
jgi:hypothetical protein